MIAIKANIVTTEAVIPGIVRIQNGVIESIDFSSVSVDDCIGMGDYFLCAGFIDLHMHGIHKNLVDYGVEALQQIVADVPKYGITGFLPTIAPRSEQDEALFIQSLTKGNFDGANILGFHLEGPFLKLTGSLSGKSTTLPSPDRVQKLISACKPFKAVFSVSPDVECITEVIPMMAANNTPVFMTHTAANVEQTQSAIKAGASHATHFYDVFPCPPVTEPGVRPCGVVEAVLADKNVSVDFILDGVHVDPIAVKMAIACKSQGPAKVCLITDSNVGAGLDPGKFSFGDSGEIYFAYKGAPARAVNGDYLAGSGLTMDQALRNAIKFLDINIVEASKMASLHPAQVLRIDDRKGKIEKGYDADFVILDQSYNIVQAWVSGNKKYDRNNEMP